MTFPWSSCAMFGKICLVLGHLSFILITCNLHNLNSYFPSLSRRSWQSCFSTKYTYEKCSIWSLLFLFFFFAVRSLLYWRRWLPHAFTRFVASVRMNSANCETDFFPDVSTKCASVLQKYLCMQGAVHISECMYCGFSTCSIVTWSLNECEAELASLSRQISLIPLDGCFRFKAKLKTYKYQDFAWHR